MRETTRETWGWAALERTARDARLALRLLRKSPGFAVTAIAVLALGIGATTAIFSVVNAVLLRPLPFAEPDRLVMVWERQPFGRANVIQTQNFLDWRARNRSFSEISAIYRNFHESGGRRRAGADSGHARHCWIFRNPARCPAPRAHHRGQGRLPGAPRVTVLSYGLWQRRFGGSFDVLGKKIDLEGAPTEMIGVMPEGFAFPTTSADLYTPMRLDPARAASDGRNYQSVARLKPGVTLAQAQLDMDTITAQTARERPR